MQNLYCSAPLPPPPHPQPSVKLIHDRMVMYIHQLYNITINDLNTVFLHKKVTSLYRRVLLF